MDSKDQIFIEQKDPYIIKKETGFTFDTKVRLHDKIFNIYNGVLFGIFAFVFILLIFYFVSLLRFRRPCAPRPTV